MEDLQHNVSQSLEYVEDVLERATLIRDGLRKQREQVASVIQCTDEEVQELSCMDELDLLPQVVGDQERWMNLLLEENQRLNASLREYEKAMEVVMIQHRKKLRDYHMEEAKDIVVLENRLEEERHISEALRSQNTNLKNKLLEMMALMKESSEKESGDLVQLSHFTALEEENAYLRKLLVLDDNRDEHQV